MKKKKTQPRRRSSAKNSMEEFVTRCKRCGKGWWGHVVYCPKAKVNFVVSHKWSECVCFIHTCYDRLEKP